VFEHLLRGLWWMEGDGKWWWKRSRFTLVVGSVMLRNRTLCASRSFSASKM
jgi:endonuclease III-like uncharacterized protein